MKLAIRVIYLLGFIALSAAAARAFVSDSPDWFGEAVYQGCIFIVITNSLLWGGSELVLKLKTICAIRIILLMVAVGAIASPSLYLVGAAFYGETKAEFDTWHLLPLFAVIHQLEAVVAGVVVGCGIATVVFIFRLLNRRWPNNSLNTGRLFRSRSKAGRLS